MNNLKKEIGVINYQAHALAAALDMLDASLTAQSVGITEQSLPKVSNDPDTWLTWTVVAFKYSHDGEVIEAVDTGQSRTSEDFRDRYEKNGWRVLAIFKGEQVNQL